MGRCVKVVEGSVGERLPSLTGADKLDPTLPDLLPRLPVLSAQMLEAALRGHADKPSGLTMGFMMGLAWDEAGVLTQDVASLGSCVEAVRGR